MTLFSFLWSGDVKIMEIEKSIKQRKPFLNEYQRALVNLLFTNGWLADRQKQFFKPYDITAKQYNILRILRGANKPLSTSDIRDRMLDKMSDTTRLVERMLKKGWVLKKINKSDRRLVDVVLSDKGELLLQQIDKTIGDVYNLVSRLTAIEAKQLNNLLDKMRGED